MLKNYVIQCGHGRAIVQGVDAEDALNEAYWHVGHRAQPKVIGLADQAAVQQWTLEGKVPARMAPLPAAAIAA